mmetsp:Transcript_33018/g.72709  ORF Transcript_33018/g.72709 Transcript_33018/m.72709 type:complete len:292 (-) Transcript_33018:180-1055(-)
MFAAVSSVVVVLLLALHAEAAAIRSRMGLSMVTPGIVIGGGRIGSYLWESNNKADLLLTHRDDVVSEGSGPIYVCTRNNDLEKIIDTTPLSRRKDLVFLQNGYLSDYLTQKELSENTQALVYFAVSKKGEKPIDGVTDLNPEGLTAVTGVWAGDLAERLQKAGLTCHVYDKDTFTAAMLEKHIWICAFMAVGVKHGCSVGDVESLHTTEVRALIGELMTTAAKEAHISFPDGAIDRLCAYARSVAHFPTALKEFEWRNGYFASISQRAMAQGGADPCPLHTAYMTAAGLMP